jgi:GDPmannose 4,6-dehydratase
VTRKVTRAVARISKGSEEVLSLGNLDAERDWGHAKDYVRGMWLILQHDKPEDFVLATGKMIKVREFVEMAFKKAGIDIEWQGSGIEEKGINKANGRICVRIDERFFRPTEVEQLLGDATKAKDLLGWVPEISLEELVSEMVEADMKNAEKEDVIRNAGFVVKNYFE